LRKSDICLSLVKTATLLVLLLFLLQVPATADDSPIKINKAFFVSEASGFGIYEKEENNHFLSGSKTSVYLEIENFSVKQGKEKFSTDIQTKLDVFNDKNEVVFTSEKVFKMKNELKSRRKDLSFKVPLDFSKWKTGRYTLTFTVRDNIREQEDSASLPLEIF